MTIRLIRFNQAMIERELIRVAMAAGAAWWLRPSRSHARNASMQTIGPASFKGVDGTGCQQRIRDDGRKPG
jgi:hypothetical protein